MKDRSIFTATKKQIKIWSQTEIQIHRDILFYTWKQTFKKRQKRLANRFVESSVHTFKNYVIHTCSESTSSSVPRESPLSPEDLENRRTSGVLTGVLWGALSGVLTCCLFWDRRVAGVISWDRWRDISRELWDVSGDLFFF